jgi:hypothetical protein
MLWWSFSYAWRVLMRIGQRWKKRDWITRFAEALFLIVQDLSNLRITNGPTGPESESALIDVVSRSLTRRDFCTKSEVEALQPWISKLVKVWIQLPELFKSERTFRVMLFVFSKLRLGVLHFLLAPLGILMSLSILVLGIVLLPAIMLALILILLLSVIPGFGLLFKKLRSALERTVGDAFVFTKDPVGRAAMLSAVQRTAEWVDSKCENYVVLAHSQGSVIVEELFKKGVVDNARKIAAYGSAIGLLNTQSRESHDSNKWVFYRTPRDPIAPVPLRQRRLLEFFFTGERLVRSWNRYSSDHTTYWAERETFVVGIIETAADANSKLAEWASQVLRSVTIEWLAFTRAKATWLGRGVATLIVAAAVSWEYYGVLLHQGYYGPGPASYLGGAISSISAWALKLLPDALLEVGWIAVIISWFDDPRALGVSLRPWIGFIALGVVSANLVRRLSWLVARQRSCLREWARHSKKAISLSRSEWQ